MPLDYTPSQSISLRAAGRDEIWLQQLVLSNPSVLGLGDLKSAGREVRQSRGGRLDFLFVDPDSDTMYEVELMLGPTDESHIIRTLEYWDVESRRWPSREHRAVIVAEEITNRFFNVIWLLNRSIPIIAIKLNAVVAEGKLILNFTKVLDIYETPETRDPSDSEAVTREQWVNDSTPESIAVFDKCVELMSHGGKAPRITFNAGHIAVGAKKNFAWFYPRRQMKHCKVELRIGETNMEPVLRRLDSAGISSIRQPNGIIRMMLTPAELAGNEGLMREIFNLAIAEGGGL
jgi:hypothetical protein